MPYEGLASIEPELKRRGHKLSASHMYQDDPLPDPKAIDGLIIMGGPMGVDDSAQHPWLVPEVSFIRSCIDSEKPVLGICLGAQLIARALGAEVRRNAYREIGWYPIERSDVAQRSWVGEFLPPSLEVFHWHGDTFELPEHTVHLASSEACRNQAFIYDERVLGLQFHLETTPESARALIDHGGHELDGSRYVQAPVDLLGTPERFERVNAVMSKLLLLFE